MSSKAKELEPERARSVRNFRIVLGAFFAGIAIGNYVESRHLMSEEEASYLWTYGRGKAIVAADIVSNGRVSSTFLDPGVKMPVFKKISDWRYRQVNAVQTIDTKYPLTGEKLRSSLLRVMFLWSFMAAAIAYTGISILEARKDG